MNLYQKLFLTFIFFLFLKLIAFLKKKQFKKKKAVLGLQYNLSGKHKESHITSHPPSPSFPLKLMSRY